MGANATTFVPAYVSGEVLTAADLTVTNSGIPVFADSTARDAAFGGTGEKTLAEGQYAYLESTNATQVYDGSNWVSVGTTPGLIPMVPTSVVVGSGSATTSAVGQVAFSGASTVSLNGIFTSAYRNYNLLVTVVPSTTMDLFMRLRAAGSDNSTASSYVSQIINARGATITTQRVTDTSWTIAPNAETTLLNAYSVRLFQPQLATATAGLSEAVTTNSTGYYTPGALTHNQTVAYDGVTIYGTSGTMTGTITAYGYNQ